MINGIGVSSKNSTLCLRREFLSDVLFQIRIMDITFSAERLKVLDRWLRAVMARLHVTCLRLGNTPII